MTRIPGESGVGRLAGNSSHAHTWVTVYPCPVCQVSVSSERINFCKDNLGSDKGNEKVSVWEQLAVATNIRRETGGFVEDLAASGRGGGEGRCGGEQQ